MGELQEESITVAGDVMATPVEHETFNRGTELQRALSTKQAAHWLRLPESDVEHLAETGELPGRNVAGVWRFGAIALNRWIEVHSIPDAAPEPVIEKLEELSAQWRDLNSKLEKVLEPIVGTSVSIASDGGVAFSGELITIEQLEKAYIFHVLARHDGSKSASAPVLGIDPATLYRKLKDY